MLSSTFYLVFASTVFMGVHSPQNKNKSNLLVQINVNVIFVAAETKSYGENFVQCANNEREISTFILKGKKTCLISVICNQLFTVD